MSVRLLASVLLLLPAVVLSFSFAPVDPATEAPAGFTSRTNGLSSQEQFDIDLAEFSETETNLPTEDTNGGVGPLYNARSCSHCHDNPVTGGSSQITELRAGHTEGGLFFEPPGGSLIHQRAIDPAIVAHARETDDIRTLRLSTSLLGLGFVECIPDHSFLALQAAQPVAMRGLIVWVPVPTTASDGDFTYELRPGRFGWKCQEASLIAFSAGAYLNEVGVTSPLQPNENTSGGRDVSQFDFVPDPEDPATDTAPFGDNVEKFARFMRATRVPPRSFELSGLDDVAAGEKLFTAIGCAVCHTPAHRTAMIGSVIKGDAAINPVPRALGNKLIHPYSDFLLHDIGSGDGIVQTQHAQQPSKGREAFKATLKRTAAPGEVVVIATAAGLDQETARKIRTAPLWGVRTRNQLMHDGASLTLEDAIQRHGGQAGDVRARYRLLSLADKKALKMFLRSL